MQECWITCVGCVFFVLLTVVMGFQQIYVLSAGVTSRAMILQGSDAVSKVSLRQRPWIFLQSLRRIAVPFKNLMKDVYVDFNILI